MAMTQAQLDVLKAVYELGKLDATKEFDTRMQTEKEARFRAGFESAECAVATDFEQAYLESGMEGLLKKAVELMNSLYELESRPYSYQAPLKVISLRK